MKQHSFVTSFSSRLLLSLMLSACNPVDFRLANPVDETPNSANAPTVEAEVPSVKLPTADPMVATSPVAERVSTPASTLDPVPTKVPALRKKRAVEVAKTRYNRDPKKVSSVPTIPTVDRESRQSPVQLKTPVQLAPQLPAQTFERAAIGFMKPTVGSCDSEMPLLGCMACPEPQLRSSVPQLSRKGESLLAIMANACQVLNNSDPVSYVPPTREQLLQRLSRLSPELYPDSPLSEAQREIIHSLVWESEEVMKIFGEIFYSGVTRPTTAFETYFGISTLEARYSICYVKDVATTVSGYQLTFTRTNATPIQSKAFSECTFLQGAFACREDEDYTSANIYRTQLREALTESVINPFRVSDVVISQNCQWAKAETRTGEMANALISGWLSKGYRVSADIPSRGLCMEVSDPRQNLAVVPVDLPIIVAAYRCR